MGEEDEDREGGEKTGGSGVGLGEGLEKTVMSERHRGS